MVYFTSLTVCKCFFFLFYKILFIFKTVQPMKLTLEINLPYSSNDITNLHTPMIRLRSEGVFATKVNHLINQHYFVNKHRHT